MALHLGGTASEGTRFRVIFSLGALLLWDTQLGDTQFLEGLSWHWFWSTHFWEAFSFGGTFSIEICIGGSV